MDTDAARTALRLARAEHEQEPARWAAALVAAREVLGVEETAAEAGVTMRTVQRAASAAGARDGRRRPPASGEESCETQS